MKQIQQIFPWQDHSYYIIAQLIQDWCLLYFHMFIDTKILTIDGTDSFLTLLTSNGIKDIIDREWKLIYRKSRDERFNDETFIKQIYENKPNILFIIETDKNNILGGYSYSGWRSGKKYTL